MAVVSLARHSPSPTRAGFWGLFGVLVLGIASAAQAQPEVASGPGAALAPLRDVDRLLGVARAALAELDEPTALRALARAEARVGEVLALPLSAAFYVEVQLQLAAAAAQASNAVLAEACLQRAARISPRRRLLLGEASPGLVAVADRIWAEAAVAPEGEVRVDADSPGARVWLDDVEVGTAPVVVRAKTGRHVLRIEAPGRRPYGAFMDLEQGRRPPQRYALAPDPGQTAPQAVAAAASVPTATRRAPAPTVSAHSESSPLWKRWYVWSAVGLVAVSAVAVVAAVASPEPERRLRVVVDPTDLR